MSERFVIQRHSDHRTHGYQVLDLRTGELHGYGLTWDDAEWLARTLNAAHVV